MPSEARRERFESLVPGLVEPVRRFLARRTDRATADDALAETLLVCWRRIDEVPDPPLPWAYGVARRCLANLERSARRQRRVIGRIAAADLPATRTHEVSGAEESVRASLARLPEKDAELLRLWAWEGLSAAEIAVVLDVTPNAASIRLHRARGKLAALLRKTGVGAGHEESMEGHQP